MKRERERDQIYKSFEYTEYAFKSASRLEGVAIPGVWICEDCND